jgi:tetratricopeptide (TPR) repeat protein
LADPDKYLSLAQKAYSIDPLDPTMLFHVSRALSFFGRYEEAFSVARELQSMDASRGRGYELVGNIRLKTGHQDTALKNYYRAYLTAPDGAEAFGYIPWILMNLSELELADAWVKELKKLTPQREYVLNQQADLAINRGRPELAVRIFADAIDRFEDPHFDRLLGRAYMFSGDFANARIAFERGLIEPGQETPQFDPDKWPGVINYAYVLQRTGAAEHATELIAETMALLEAQLVAGVVSVFRDFNLQANMAQLHALNGNAQLAMAALRRAAQQGGLQCLWCLRKLPQYDNLHDNADFISLIAEQEAKIDAQRQRLADEGMLLTPEEVLALNDFSFDPFLIE